MKRISTSYARAQAHTRPRAYACGRTLAARSSRQTMLGGGLSLQTLSSEERLRCAPFLTVLGTHSISRSFPLPPQRMLASPAAASTAAGPATHVHPAASKRPLNQTPHAHAARCGQQRDFVSAPPSHAGRGEYSGSVLLSGAPPPQREAQTPASSGRRWRRTC